MERLRVLGIMMMWAIMWYNRGKMYLSGEQGTKKIIKFHFPLKIQSGQNPSFLCQLWPNCFQHFGEGEKKGWVDLCFKLGGFLQPISQLFWTDPTVYIKYVSFISNTRGCWYSKISLIIRVYCWNLIRRRGIRTPSLTFSEVSWSLLSRVIFSGSQS